MPDNEAFKNVLCIRADNMGDVIMSSPAMRALKETFGSRITLLTSRAGALVIPHLDCVDASIVTDLPWVGGTENAKVDLSALAAEIGGMHFDAAVIFSVYSQSALPAAMLAYQAGVPLRLAYARENPYQLLTNWVPDPEPYSLIRHQVERDLELVKSIGATTSHEKLQLNCDQTNADSLSKKLTDFGIAPETPFVILHPGVSEEKRKYPLTLWIETGKQLAETLGLTLIVTGSPSEKATAAEIAERIGERAHNVAGVFTLGEFIDAIARARCVVSVNTSSIHIAAAMQTPVVVLYAQTNPQHTPWQSPHEILPFSVAPELQSRNPIIRDVAAKWYAEHLPFPEPSQIVEAVGKWMKD